MQLAKRLIPAVLFYLACAFVASAQSTTVSGTVTDAGSQAWLNGTYSFTFQPNPQYPTGPYTWTGGTLNTTISGSLNGSGAYSVSIPSSSAITPAGSTWILTVTPNASSNSFSTPRTTITGGTQTLNVTPPAIAINWSLPPGPALSAYADAEITGTLPPGAEYFNTTTLLTRVWNGSAWNNQGSGSGSGVTSVTGTSPIVATPTTGAVGVSCPTCLLQPTGSGVQGEPAIYQGNSLTLGPSNQYIDISPLPGANWGAKLAACNTAVASSGTCLVPDSEASDGALTAVTLGANTNVQFTGSAVFSACNITLGTTTHFLMGGVTLQSTGSGCTLLKQTANVFEQNTGKLIIADGTLDCNNQVGCTGVNLGNVTNAVVERVSFKNITDYSTSTVSAPTGGLVLQATQFDRFVGLKFWNVAFPIKCYVDPTAGGCSSLYFDNPNIAASGCVVGTIIANRSALTNLQWGDDTFVNPVIQGCSVAGQAGFGNTNVGGPAEMTILRGGPELNGTAPLTLTFTNSSASIAATNTLVAGQTLQFATTGSLPTNFATGTTYYVLSTGLTSSAFEVSATSGGSAITAGSAGSGTQTANFVAVVDGFTVKQASTYLNYTQLFYDDVSVAEATVTPIINAENGSVVIVENPTGSAGQTFTLTDATSNTVLIGPDNSASGLSAFGNLSTFAPITGTNKSHPAYFSAKLASGSAANFDQMTIQNVCGGGVNPNCAIMFAHPSGTSGIPYIDFSGLSQVNFPSSSNANITATQWSLGNAQITTSSNVLATGDIQAANGFTETDGTFGSQQVGKSAACETNFGITTLSGASTTTGQNCLPANAIIDAVVYRITTTITTATSFTIGDSGSATRYCGTQSTLTSGTTGICTAQGYYLNSSALGVKITPSTTPGAGAMRLIVYYHTWTAPTS